MDTILRQRSARLDGYLPRLVSSRYPINIPWFAVNFDNLTTDWELGPGTIGQGGGATDVDSYVEACKCDGVQSFTCDSSPLLPNIELIICIKSVSPDVEIDILNSMVSCSFSNLVIFYSSCQSSNNFLPLYCRL